MCGNDHSLASSRTTFGWNRAICKISYSLMSSRTTRGGFACGDAILARQVQKSEHLPMEWSQHGCFVVLFFFQQLLNFPN